MTTFSPKGKEVFGNWVDDWDYNETGGELNAAQKMVLAYDYGEDFSVICLSFEGEEMDEETQNFCNLLCDITLTEQQGFGIKDLVDTGKTICNNDGVFVPGDTVDMSMTDLLRAGGYDARTVEDVDTCTAKGWSKTLSYNHDK